MLLPVRIRSHGGREVVEGKMPHASALFWVRMLLATAAGASFAFLLPTTLDCGLTRATGLMLGALALALEYQTHLKQHDPLAFWMVIVAMTTTDVLFIDNLRFNLSVDVEITTVAFSALLLLALGCWYSIDTTLSIDLINSPRRETMYWLVLLFALALGKSVSDLTPQTLESMGYGFYASLLGLSSVLAVSSRWLFKTNPVPLYWTACILICAVGVSLGDRLCANASDSVDRSHHGSGAHSGSSADGPPSALGFGLAFIPLAALLLGVVRVAKDPKTHEPQTIQPLVV